MIVVRLIGGLGNQLFQYAAGRHLAEKNQDMLKLDLSGYEQYKLHKYSLHHFNIREEMASPEEVTALTRRNQSLIERALRRAMGRTKLAPAHFREKHFHFDPSVMSLEGNIYLDGYWQSERYFKAIEGIIRKELTVKHPLAENNFRSAEMIRNTESVSLHVRRKDYVSDSDTRRKHGLCSPDYYCRCAAEISRLVENPHVFIFTDSPDWVNENLDLSCPSTLVDQNRADQNYEDLRLMSLCRHNIVANSTFSWWGAWLNRNPDKMVFAPEKWYGDPSYNTDDVVPEAWVRI